MRYQINFVMFKTRAVALAFASLGCVATAVQAQPTLFGPTQYTCFSDSPFSGLSFGFFHLETFEDHLFNVPGVQVNQGGVTSVVFGRGLTDSVDCDDGVLDGSGLLGDSFFGSADMRFTFGAAALGSLPTHAGLVWTDGGGGAVVIFEAYDPSGISLGTVTGNHADASNNGTTGEDRFYGVFNAAGISGIRISHNSGGLEVDHLQYGGGVSVVLCLADLVGGDGNPPADGSADGNDFVAFLNAFGAGAPLADLVGGDGNPPADGSVDGNDFQAFLNSFAAGC